MMRETIFLVVSKHRVERMTKRLPDLARGEIPVKLIIEVADTAFREPVIERKVEIIDWRDGIEVGDLDLRESFITEEEAQVIRTRRLWKMRELLEREGYVITPKDEDEAEPEEPDAAPPE
jgi:hypothetical protein